MIKGIIVSFEGIDGCGKTTLVKMFYKYLIKNGLNPVVLHEPGDTIVGEKIRKILLGAKYEKIDKFCEFFLYLASRSQLIEKKIKKHRKEGRIIILDRYIDSTYAYQGYGRGISLKFINDIHKVLIGKNYEPNITFLIDEKPENLIKILKKKKKDRIEKESIEFQKKVRKGYLLLAERNKRIKVVKRKDKEKTFKEIIEIWEKFLDENRRSKNLLVKSKR
ncbi:MAG: dTMP kinase [Candidatus Omnitrophica bacterium]|nr:dTMP kinase [Candidatus Omnitrophota bacterium]